MVLRMKSTSFWAVNLNLTHCFLYQSTHLKQESQKYHHYRLKSSMTAHTNDRRVTGLLKDAQNSLTTSSSFKPCNKRGLQKSPGIRSRSPHRKHFNSDERIYFY